MAEIFVYIFLCSYFLKCWFIEKQVDEKINLVSKFEEPEAKKLKSKRKVTPE